MLDYKKVNLFNIYCRNYDYKKYMPLFTELLNMVKDNKEESVFLMEHIITSIPLDSFIKDLFLQNKEYYLDHDDLFKWSCAFCSKEIVGLFAKELHKKNERSAITACIINGRFENLWYLEELGFSVFQWEYFNKITSRALVHMNINPIYVYIKNKDKIKESFYKEDKERVLKDLANCYNLLGIAIEEGKTEIIDFFIEESKENDILCQKFKRDLKIEVSQWVLSLTTSNTPEKFCEIFDRLSVFPSFLKAVKKDKQKMLQNALYYKNDKLLNFLLNDFNDKNKKIVSPQIDCECLTILIQQRREDDLWGYLNKENIKDFLKNEDDYWKIMKSCINSGNLEVFNKINEMTKDWFKFDNKGEYDLLKTKCFKEIIDYNLYIENFEEWVNMMIIKYQTICNDEISLYIKEKLTEDRSVAIFEKFKIKKLYTSLNDGLCSAENNMTDKKRVKI